MEVEIMKQRIKEWETDYLARKARNEMRIAKFAESYKKLPESLRNVIQLPEEITLKAIMPEYYVEHPNPEVCKQQFNDWKEKEALFNVAVENYFKEMIATCESELARLNSSAV